MNKIFRNAEGSILLLCIVFLFLMGLMGASIVLSTRTEYKVSDNTRKGRDAFSKADATARMAVLFGRSVQYPSLGPVDAFIKTRSDEQGRPPFEVQLIEEFGDKLFTTLWDSGSNDDIVERYLMATAATNPHLTLYYGQESGQNKRQLAGSAAIAQHTVLMPGSSISNGEYGGPGTSSGSGIKVVLVISASGNSLPPAGSKTGDDSYFDGRSETAHSVVTAVYQEVLP